jgi:hypothetical protein
MRQKTQIHRNQGSNDKKMFFFASLPKSPTQMGSRGAKNASEKFTLSDPICIGDLKIEPKNAFV